MLENHYDIVVAGGGMAVALAAIAAVKAGCRVLLVEREECLGGIGTSAMVSELMAVAWKGKTFYGGVTQEIFDELVRSGSAEYNYNVPMSSDPSIHVDRLRCNPESVKILLEEKVLGARANILYGALCVGAKETEDGFVLDIQTHHESREVRCDYLIDATGSAFAANLLGYETVRTPKEDAQTSSLIFRLGNLDPTALADAIRSGAIQPIITRGFQSGALKGRILGIAPIPNTKDATVNVTRTNVDYEDAEDYTRGLCEARSQIAGVVAFMREQLPGCANATLGAIAASLGVRDARRIVGEYTLTAEDILQQTPFYDSAALCAYPMDVHDPHTRGVLWKDVPGVYKIPMRSMIPRGSRRLLVAGRAISATAEAFSSVRVMPPVMNLGEAAGCIAACLSETKTDLTKRNVEELHARMTQNGMKF